MNDIQKYMLKVIPKKPASIFEGWQHYQNNNMAFKNDLRKKKRFEEKILFR